MYVLKDWRVLTWGSIILILVALLAMSYGAGSATVATNTSVKDSQAQGTVSQLNYVVYQGISQGNNRAGVSAWLDEVSAIAERGREIRSEETDTSTDALLTGFAAVAESAEYGARKLNDPQVEPSSVRRNTVSAIMYLQAAAKGFEVAPFKNLVPVEPEREVKAKTPEVPASPNSDEWPFKEDQ